MLRKLQIFYLAVFLSFTATAYSEHNPLKSLAGPPFSDPSQLQEMPEGWENQPIKYNQSAGNADIVITLDQHLYTALLPVIQQYEKKHKLKIIINEGTCGISSGKLAGKTVDIGGFCCAPGKTDRLPGLQFHTVGIDAIALIVHPDNPVDNITLGQARQIYMGDIYRWSKLNTSQGNAGMDIPIQAVGRLHCKLRPGHWHLLLGNEDFFDPGLKEVGAIPDMIAQVALDPGAIGYEVLWNTVRFKDKGDVKALMINGYSPYKADHLISVKYPLYRVYNLTTWEGTHIKNPRARELVKHLLERAEHLDKIHNIIPASRLKKAGWKFRGNELVGEPEMASQNTSDS